MKDLDKFLAPSSVNWRWKLWVATIVCSPSVIICRAFSSNLFKSVYCHKLQITLIIKCAVVVVIVMVNKKKFLKNLTASEKAAKFNFRYFPRRLRNDVVSHIKFSFFVSASMSEKIALNLHTFNLVHCSRRVAAASFLELCNCKCLTAHDVSAMRWWWCNEELN